MALLEFDEWKETADIDDDLPGCLRECLWTYLNEMAPDHDGSIAKQLDQMDLAELRVAVAGYALDLTEMEEAVMCIEYQCYVDNYDPKDQDGDYWYDYHRDVELSRECE